MGGMTRKERCGRPEARVRIQLRLRPSPRPGKMAVFQCAWRRQRSREQVAVLGCHQGFPARHSHRVSNIGSRVPRRATERCSWPVPIPGAKNVGSILQPCRVPGATIRFVWQMQATTRFGEVRTPTLVVHANNDAMRPLRRVVFRHRKSRGAVRRA
jgi:hypothetical protein